MHVARVRADHATTQDIALPVRFRGTGCTLWFTVPALT